MGQTLTHGVYLPDEGERNCYNGLAANWQILDSSVGTIAAHTAALSGKAPLVHTHSKADITDLFNSANTWTGDNTYTTPVNYKSTHTLGNLPVSVDAQQAFRILDSAGTDFLCDTASFQNTTASGLRFTIRDKFDSDGFSPSGTNRSSYLHFLQNANSQSYLQWDGYTKNSVVPLTSNTYDLGTSSYQWNNLYAKNYYYNGTAWGLDKSNVWTGTNTFQQNITYEKSNFFHKAVNPNYYLKDSELQIGVTPNSPHIACPGNWQDKNDQQLGYVRFVQYENSIQTFECDIRNKVSNGAWNPNGTLQTVGFQIVNNPTVSKGDFRLYANLVPNSDNNYDLGTATKRWKTINGINPGALSLPDYAKTVNIDTTNWNTTGTKIDYTPPENCLIQIVTHNESGNKITVLNKYTSPEWGDCVCGNGTANNLFFEKLLEGGRTYYIYITDTNASPTVRARYIPLLGNV